MEKGREKKLKKLYELQDDLHSVECALSNIETTNKKGIWIKENDKLVKYKIGKGDII